MKTWLPLSSHAGRWTLLALLVAGAGGATDMGLPASAQSSTFKVAYYNVQSGKGTAGLPGRSVHFATTSNCTDTSQPLNAWGTGFFQEHLRAALSDPAIVALGVSEAWPCATPSSLRQALGWNAHSGERNGVSLLARHGFAGPEEWVQLDTSLNVSPRDTMWVLRRPVCLDASCSASIDVFSAHWYAEGVRTDDMVQYYQTLWESYSRQAMGTVAFLQRAGGADPHILIGDLNTWEGSVFVCEQEPVNAGLSYLRDAGYLDAWPLLHGGAEGFTGMLNRRGCGTPEGYAWKRPDYVWSPAHYAPVAISRFGMVPPGDAAPSDHYGLIAEFPWPGTVAGPVAPPPSSDPAPAGEIVLHARDASAVVGTWQAVPDASAAGGTRLWNPDAGAPKLTTASASPASYFEVTFTAEAGRPYRLWIRGQAENNAWTNDSVFVQFSGSVTESGTPEYRIGTTAATSLSVEEGSGAGLSGWGWQDAAYGGVAPPVYFASSGSQTIRIQQREDGVSIDQVILSPSMYLTVSPGASKNDSTIYAASSGSTSEPPPLSPSEPPPPSGSAAEILLYAAHAQRIGDAWRLEPDGDAAGGARLWSADRGLPKLPAPAAAPASYVELTFTADAGRGYRLWVRGTAENNAWTNDSAFVQFSGSLNEHGSPDYRIGTSSATIVSIEEGSEAGLSGWGWQDNASDGPGPLIYFAVSGPQTIRIQQREDGISLDQIVLSAGHYLWSAPGAPRNDTTILR